MHLEIWTRTTLHRVVRFEFLKHPTRTWRWLGTLLEKTRVEVISEARNREKGGIYIGVERALPDMRYRPCTFKRSEVGQKEPVTPTSQLLWLIFDQRAARRQRHTSPLLSIFFLSVLQGTWKVRTSNSGRTRQIMNEFTIALIPEEERRTTYNPRLSCLGRRSFSSETFLSFWILESWNELTFFTRREEEDDMLLVLVLFGSPNLVIQWGALSFGVHRTRCWSLIFGGKEEGNMLLRWWCLDRETSPWNE